MDVRRITESLIQTGIKRKLEEWGIPEEISVSVEVPRQEEHGDFSTNAALQLAGHMKRKP
ncbi:MAG: arginine--tRNA ligase, partial [Deltaproteobacteria bacterium]|nr:arginine--tRNA ligase [Deltaproteobacteria bacterium]